MAKKVSVVEARFYREQGDYHRGKHGTRYVWPEVKLWWSADNGRHGNKGIIS